MKSELQILDGLRWILTAIQILCAILFVFFVASLLTGCDADVDLDGRSGPTGVQLTVNTECAPTGVPGEIVIFDQSFSTPGGHITLVSGRLIDSSSATRCRWSIQRQNNSGAGATCRGLESGEYSFAGNIETDTGQLPTETSGSCSLKEGASS